MDHLGGFGAVLDALPVAHAMDTGDPVPSRGYAAFLDRAAEEGVEWLRAGPGDRLTLDEVRVTVLGPIRRAHAGEVASRPNPGAGKPSSNATSLAARVTVNGFVYVNTGDATAAEELALMARWPGDSLQADVLKIGHHGSRSSTDPAWLRSTRPALALISAGRGNTYGHPHATVLRRLREASVPRVWRTDRDGTLCVEIERHGRWRIRGEEPWSHPSGMARVLTSGKETE
jgi:competence protein ComEC